MIPKADFEALKATIAAMPEPKELERQFCFDCGTEITVSPWRGYWYMRHPRAECAHSGRYEQAPTKDDVLAKWDAENPF